MGFRCIHVDGADVVAGVPFLKKYQSVIRGGPANTNGYKK
jgi:hypothetical protein